MKILRLIIILLLLAIAFLIYSCHKEPILNVNLKGQYELKLDDGSKAFKNLYFVIIECKCIGSDYCTSRIPNTSDCDTVFTSEYGLREHKDTLQMDGTFNDDVWTQFQQTGDWTITHTAHNAINKAYSKDIVVKIR